MVVTDDDDDDNEVIVELPLSFVPVSVVGGSAFVCVIKVFYLSF